MTKIVLAAIMLFATFSANAVNLAFKFEVTSSGNSLYACNAGLKHAPSTERVCYERSNPSQSCDPVACKVGEACHCVCTGGKNVDGSYNDDAGEYRLDYMQATYANWSDNGEAPTNFLSAKYSANKDDFRTLFTDSAKFGKQLTSLEFFLGSERYNAEYFVDLCFRATQIVYPSSFSNNDVLNWRIDAGVTVTDLGTTASSTPYSWDTTTNEDYYTAQTYQSLARLTSKVQLVCKNKNGSLSAVNRSSSVVDMTTAQVAKLLNNVNTREDLKGCYFRYTFKETDGNTVVSVRKWKKQKARICTQASVNEPLDE